MLSFDSIGSDLLFEPDGAVNADDRAELLGLYGGNQLAVGGGPVGRYASVRHKNIKYNRGP